jgi:isoleucyl-tRNA synthetase
LGALAGFAERERLPEAEMPELERYILHRLWQLDAHLRRACNDFEFHGFYAALLNFCAVELSAFYFDIRKDTLYCEPYSSADRKAALEAIEQIFRCTTLWLAPLLCFTAEETWLARYPSETGSVHVELFPDVPATWRNDALAEKWEAIKRVRRVVTGALEIERAAKKIGSSLEAAPQVYIADKTLSAALKGVDLAQVCITSAIDVRAGEGPQGAFRLDDVPDVSVVTELAEGRKCARSWRITKDVGEDPAFPELSARDAAAVREFDARSGRRS